MSYRPFESSKIRDSSMSIDGSSKRPRGTTPGIYVEDPTQWKGPEYTAWSVYNSLIQQIDRNAMAVIRSLDVDSCLQDPPYSQAYKDWQSYITRFAANTLRSKHMKETKQTIKLLATDVSTDHPTYPYGGPITSVTGECLSGGRATISGLSDEMRKEMILALQQRLAVEITITVKRPETPLEEVRRLQIEKGDNYALVVAKQYLAGVK